MSIKYKRENGKIIVLGNTFPIKDKLKALGAKFQGDSKTWVLTESSITLELMEDLEAFELVENENLFTKEPTLPLKASPKSLVQDDFFVPSISKDPKESQDLKISELIQLAQKSISDTFPFPIWVVGEVHNINIKSSAVFLTISESKESSNKDIASLEVRTVMWADTSKKIKEKIGSEIFDRLLSEGTQIRAKVAVSLYKDRAQLSLQIFDLDASYTQGAIARARAELIKELTSKGLDRKNKELTLVDFPLKVGLISSRGSRAYSDFLDQLLSLGYCGKVIFCNAATQGEEVSTSVCQALDRLQQSLCDVIVLTRGGGSAADLRWFDSREIAYKIAECKVPVIAAIGHHDDISVAEMIAHTRQKTPTAAADFVINIQNQTLKKIQSYMMQLHQSLLWRRDTLHQQISLLSHRLRSISNQSIQKKFLWIERQQHHFKFLIQKKTASMQAIVQQLFHNLEKFSLNYVSKQIEVWMQLEKKLLSLDPTPWLKDGWTRLSLSSNKKSVKSIHEVTEHELLEARLLDGSLLLEVKNLNIKSHSKP